MKKITLMLAVCIVAIQLTAQTTKKTAPPPPPPPAPMEVSAIAPPPPPLPPTQAKTTKITKKHQLKKETIQFTPPKIVKDKEN